MSLYLLINILSIGLPLLLSFDKRVHFYTSWKYLFPAMFITMTLFIVWDVIFTAQGVWGFNERYHGHIKLWGLPLEEILFFISVPYASIFTLQVLKAYFPDFRAWHSSVQDPLFNPDGCVDHPGSVYDQQNLYGSEFY